MINAYIEQARNFDYEKGDKLAFLEHLMDMEENRENRPFLDRIYKPNWGILSQHGKY